MEPSRGAEFSQIHLDKLSSESSSRYHAMTNHCPLGREEVAMTTTGSYCKLIKNVRCSQDASVAAVFLLKDEQRKALKVKVSSHDRQYVRFSWLATASPTATNMKPCTVAE